MLSNTESFCFEKSGSSETGLFLIISGISGIGKSFFAHHLHQYHNFRWVPAITTRPPRRGESDGSEKIFCDENVYLQWRGQGKLVLEKYMFGYWYAFRGEDLRLPGTSFYERVDRVCLLRYDAIEPMKRILPTAKVIYIKPHDVSETEERLRERCLKNEETEQRLKEMHRELAYIRSIEGTPSQFYDHAVENDYTSGSLEAFTRAVNILKKRHDIKY